MTIDDLKNYGANTDEGMRRCLNNEGFYLRLVKMIPNDPNFQKLFDAVDGNDLTAGFEAAHALKGSTGNLSLVPIFEPISEITELLRAKVQTDYSELLQRIRRRQEDLRHICEN